VLAFTQASWTYAVFVLPLIAIAAGLGLPNGPASSASTSAVDEAEVGQASGISNMARYVGAALAVAATAAVYNSAIESHTAAGESAGEALAAGLARASIVMGAMVAVGIILAGLMRHHRTRPPTMVDRAAASAVMAHTILATFANR
jgi:hypothetical protein